jgi:hypothetical protein
MNTFYSKMQNLPQLDRTCVDFRQKTNNKLTFDEKTYSIYHIRATSYD